MPLLEAVIGAGGSLLGGLLGKGSDAQKNTRLGVLGQAAGARQAAAKYGFNPLTLLGVSQPLGPSSSENYMGNAIADAALLVADGMNKNAEEKGKLAEAEAENQKLREKVTSLTIRPKVGGLYAERDAVPSAPPLVERGANMIGPLPPVSVRDAVTGNWLDMHPGVAKRLRIEAGDTLIAEDKEALYGDMVSEAQALANVGEALAGNDKSMTDRPSAVPKAQPKLSVEEMKRRGWRHTRSGWKPPAFGF